MAFRKIIPSDYNDKDVSGLPNQPTISPTALKQRFDAPAKEVVGPAVNSLIDALEATTAAADIGAVAPIGRVGTTVQGVMNSISGDLDTAEANIVDLQGDSHTHDNKALLDTYTQAEADLAQAVADDHTHSNKALLDTYTHSDTDIGQAITDDHTHSNKPTLDKWSESGGDIYFDGVKVGKGTVDNAIKNVKVGASTIVASGEDTLEIVAGDNIILTPDTANKKVEIKSTGGGGGGGANWGSIGGTLSDQTDLASALNGKADSSHIHGMSDLSGFNITSAQDGELLTYDSATSKWKNKAPDKSFARYAGAKTFAELTSALLISDNVDKFYLCTDGGTIESPDDANWVLPEGSIIPPDSHIAVIEDPDSPGSYLFDDFGGYVDISGKADKTELDSYTELKTQTNGTVIFDNLNPNYGYALEWDDSSASGNLAIPKWTNCKKESGTNAGTIKYTYTISGGSNGASKFALRIKK